MISKRAINNVLSEYDHDNIKVGTICSHSALQIFYGAKQEGFKGSRPDRSGAPAGQRPGG